MRFPDEFLDEIKARVRLSDVIGRKVRLKKQGRDYVGLSPFTSEKTPSFHVHDEEGFYKCFSSQKGGNLFNFLMETENLTFPEAVERAAGLAGLELPTTRSDEAATYRRRASLQVWAEKACEFFEAQLQSPAGKVARDYLTHRGLSPDAWSRHRLGFAPDGWRNLADHLTRQGATLEELVEAGLLVQPDGNGKAPYDRFRNRLMFPIADPSGKTIAFGARTLDPDGTPKYLNSSDSPLFHKGHTLYRFGSARHALAMSKSTDNLSRGLVVTEGYMDAISLAEAGVETAVAPLGTALTTDQMELLWRAGPEPILCLDGDKAGISAAYKALDRALPLLEPTKTLFFVILPDGQDPDDLVRSEGAEAMRARLNAAEPLVDMLWRRELAAEPLDTPERKASFEARLMEAVGKIQHAGLKKAYERELRDRIYWEFRGGRESRRHSGQLRSSGSAGQRPQLRGLGNLLRAIDSPAILELAREAICATKFPDADVNAIRDAAFSVLEHADGLDRRAVAAHLRSLGRSEAIELLSMIPTGLPISMESPEGQELLDALNRFRVANSMRSEALSEVQERERDGLSALGEARSRAVVLDRQRFARWSPDEHTGKIGSDGERKVYEALEGLETEVTRRSGT